MPGVTYTTERVDDSHPILITKEALVTVSERASDTDPVTFKITSGHPLASRVDDHSPVLMSYLNTAPSVGNVKIAGVAEVGEVLTLTYDYHDLDSDGQGLTLIAWMRGPVPILGETGLTYTLVADDIGEMIAAVVTPVAATGTTPGADVVSNEIGPVVAA